MNSGEEGKLNYPVSAFFKEAREEFGIETPLDFFFQFEIKPSCMRA